MTSPAEGVVDDDAGAATAYNQYREVCLDLNMDSRTIGEAWRSYCQVRQHYSLEGCRLHWLACALYVASRSSHVPAVTPHNGHVQGNFISLTRLLRSCRLSLLEFFDKSVKWADMSNMPASFRKNLDTLQRNFAVTMFLFNNYFSPIFRRLFGDPSGDAPRPPRSRKQRPFACNRSELLRFAWTLFVLVKSHIASVTCDLVGTYHLLLACLDFVHGAVVVADRRDLLNAQSGALPSNFDCDNYEPPQEPQCVLEFLCEQFDGLIVEVKGVRQHSLREKLLMLFQSGVLIGDARTTQGLLDADVFESSCKNMNKRYEEYLLTCGNFDERTFLGERALEEIGMPSRLNNFSVMAGDLAHRIMLRRSLMLENADPEPLVPTTPLTGRGYLTKSNDAGGVKENDGGGGLVSTSMQSVVRLQTLLAGREPQPSSVLRALLDETSAASATAVQTPDGCEKGGQNVDLYEQITSLLSEMEQQFIAACTLQFSGRLETQDLVKRRFTMATALYYKQLENIVLAERRREPNVDLMGLLRQSVFHRCLFSCSLEIVLYAYNTSSLEFPWLLEALAIEPYDFYKLLEIIIREEQALCRDIIKHLSQVEELILDSMVWRSNSRLWVVVEAANGRIPTSETVALPSGDLTSAGESARRQPPVTPTPLGASLRGGIRRVCMERPMTTPQQSPLSSMASERFMSPVSSSARRRLFATTTAASVSSAASGNGELAAAVSSPMTRLTVKPAHTRVLTFSGSSSSVVSGNDVRQPMSVVNGTSDTGNVKRGESGLSSHMPPKVKQNSLGLFFRKFYHLAWVRMRELCDRLELNCEVRQTIWTVFEYVIVHHLEVMQGRHLDQLIMSSVFVVCKAFGINKKFTDIICKYRFQPQARSHVYRSVLLGVRPKVAAEKGDTEAVDSPIPTAVSGDKPISSGVICPPTPSQLAGTATSYCFDDRDEERGDIIQFYNQVFVQRVKTFLGRFTRPGDVRPPLSPLPSPRHSPLSFSRRVCPSVYVSPLKQPPSLALSDRVSVRSYSFSRSPANDLRSINAMLSTPPPTSVSSSGGPSSVRASPRRLALSSPRVLHVMATSSTAAAAGGLHVARQHVLPSSTSTSGVSVSQPQEKFKARLMRVIDHRHAHSSE